MFADRTEAGRLLGEEFAARGFGDRGDVLVLGIPRGGVEVAAEVARAIGAPFDVVVARKVGAPGNPEFAVGAVGPDGPPVLGDSGWASDDWVRESAETERVEARRRLEAYRGERPYPDVTGKKVVVVDDGVATGLTARAALVWLRSKGARSVIMAAPVMAPGAVRSLDDVSDEVVALEVPAGFQAVGAFYRDFRQLTDDDVRRLLAGSG